MQYFNHDTTASNDDKIIALRLMHSGAAVDAYWTLLEKIYADEAPLNLSETNVLTKSVSFRLGVGLDTLTEWVSTMLEIGLFTGSVENLTSARAQANIEAYQQKVETARENGKKGGRKPSTKTDKKPKANQGGNQTAKLIKENKIKEIGLDKTKPISISSSVAVAGIPAPLDCPNCDAPMEPTHTYKPGTNSRLWRCPLCATEHYEEVPA